MKSKMNINQTVMGQVMNIAMDITAKVSFDVQSFEEGMYQIKVKYDEMKMAIDAGQGSIEFGSALEAMRSPLDSIMLGLTESSFSMSVTPKGKVTEVKDLDKIFDNLFSSFGSFTDQEKSQMRAQIEDTYGQEALKSNFEQSFVFIPEDAVAVGDKWELNSVLSGQYPVKVNGKYSLKSVTDSTYTIANSSEINMNSDEKINTQGIDMNMEITGTMAGDIVIEKTTGWILNSMIEQTFKGKVIVGATEMLPAGMEMPIAFTNHMTITGE
jgi:hypothetical protein